MIYIQLLIKNITIEGSVENEYTFPTIKGGGDCCG